MYYINAAYPKDVKQEKVVLSDTGKQIPRTIFSEGEIEARVNVVL
jgi:hypothetical protein